jgi:hypothetical protein
VNLVEYVPRLGQAAQLITRLYVLGKTSPVDATLKYLHDQMGR